MTAKQAPRKTGTDTQNTVVLVGSGFIAGLLVGLVIMGLVGSSGSPGGSGAPAPITPGQQQGPDRVKLSREIAQAEEIVRKDPGNYQAWVQIGNDYFDIGEPQKSVEAYGRALAIKDGDPNVMTDMGIMYRQIGEFTKAVELFRKAAAADPTHPQSRLNLGIVLLHDLNDPKAAMAAWEDFLRAAPNDPNAEQIRRSLRELGANETGGVDLEKAARELSQQASPPAAK